MAKPIMRHCPHCKAARETREEPAQGETWIVCNKCHHVLQRLSKSPGTRNYNASAGKRLPNGARPRVVGEYRK